MYDHDAIDMPVPVAIVIRKVDGCVGNKYGLPDQLGRTHRAFGRCARAVVIVIMRRREPVLDARGSSRQGEGAVGHFKVVVTETARTRRYRRPVAEEEFNELASAVLTGHVRKPD